MPTINGVEYAHIIHNTGFNTIPKEERGHGASTDFCCCRYCSKTQNVSEDNPDGVWDTLATNLTTGEQWKVHFPELHGREPKREHA
jgi:hypothetical protein